jgi:hypothetical protein
MNCFENMGGLLSICSRFHAGPTINMKLWRTDAWTRVDVGRICSASPTVKAEK